MSYHESKAAHAKMSKVMGEFKGGTLRSSSGRKVRKRKQAIAIGLSEARRTSRLGKLTRNLRGMHD